MCAPSKNAAHPNGPQLPEPPEPFAAPCRRAAFPFTYPCPAPGQQAATHEASAELVTVRAQGGSANSLVRFCTQTRARVHKRTDERPFAAARVRLRTQPMPPCATSDAKRTSCWVKRPVLHTSDADVCLYRHISPHLLGHVSLLFMPHRPGDVPAQFRSEARTV